MRIDMWTQIGWSTPLPISECEQRLRNMPTRLWLVTRRGESQIVAGVTRRGFRLMVAGPAWRVLVAPYFYGFLIDRHGATEIRGRLSPAPLAVSGLLGCLLAVVPLSLSGVAFMRGTPLPIGLTLVPSVVFCAFLAFMVAGWRGGRREGPRIAACIESRFDAHRLTGDWSRRRAAAFPS